MFKKQSKTNQKKKKKGICSLHSFRKETKTMIHCFYERHNLYFLKIKSKIFLIKITWGTKMKIKNNIQERNNI